MGYGAKELAEGFRTVRKNTLKIAEEVPADKYDFRTTPETRSVGELLSHIAVAYGFQHQIHAVERSKTLEGLAQIESARSVPSIKVLCKIASALKVSVAAFLRRHATNGIEHLAGRARHARRDVRMDVSRRGRFIRERRAVGRRIPRTAHRAAAYRDRHRAARRARR